MPAGDQTKLPNFSVSHCPTRRLCRCRQGLEIVGCEHPADSALAPSAGTPIKLAAMVDGHVAGEPYRAPADVDAGGRARSRSLGGTTSLSPSPAATLAISCADAEQVSRHSPGALRAPPSFILRRLPPVHQPIHVGQSSSSPAEDTFATRRSAGSAQRSRMNRQASITCVGCQASAVRLVEHKVKIETVPQRVAHATLQLD
jgi:hypothetical protein